MSKDDDIEVLGTVDTTFSSALRKRLALYADGMPQRYDRLLQWGWWPTVWARESERLETPCTDIPYLAAVEWYKELRAAGWSPIRWEHAERGVTNLVDGKWDNQIPADRNIDFRKERKWNISIGPDRGRAGEVKQLSASMCGLLFYPEKLLMAESIQSEPCACTWLCNHGNWVSGDGSRTRVESVLFGYGPGAIEQKLKGPTSDFKGIDVSHLLSSIDGGLNMYWNVQFAADAVWYATIIGKVWA